MFFIDKIFNLTVRDEFIYRVKKCDFETQSDDLCVY